MMGAAMKVLGAAMTLLIALSIAFLLTRAAGDPVIQIIGENATEEQVEALRTELGLDRALPLQYLDYLGDIARLDLGSSARYRTSNWELLRERLLPTVQLAVLAIALGLAFGIPLGALAGMREGTWLDRLAVTSALLGQSMPAFWVGIMMVSIFAVGLGWFPAGQAGTWQHLILPGVTLSLLPMARVARLTRAAVVESLQSPYITAARSRGYRESRVFFRHVARNTAVPVLTITGLQVGALLSGTVTVEVVFAWPGLGTLAVQAVQFRDFELVQAIVVFGAVTFVAVNLLVDLAALAVDPRTREGSS